MTNRMPVDPEIGVPDLIRRLGDDSKRLVEDEIELAKLELKDGAHKAARGTLWLAIAFGVGVVALVAFTIFLATLIGRAVNGHMWVGAIVTGIVEIAIAVLLLKRGLMLLKQPSYTFVETRRSLSSS